MRYLLLVGLFWTAANQHALAVSVTVSPGDNPTVTVNIESPGTTETISVTAASGWQFSQNPYIANNPTGLWWDNGNNTFSVVFLSGGDTSADVTVAGKLVPVGGGGGGGTPPEYDFSLPGVAVLTGNVGATFEKPTEYWWMEGETVPCKVRFYSADGTVTAVGSDTYTWIGDNLGSFSARTFASQAHTFTYAVATGAAGKQGQIKGDFSGIKVDGAGAFSAKATSIMQKAFKVEFHALDITEQTAPQYQNNTLTCEAVMWGYLKPTPEDSQIPVQLRMVQTCCTYGENQYNFDGPHSLKMIYYTSSGNFYYDGIREGADWDPEKKAFFCRFDDSPVHPVPTLSTYKSSYRYDQFVVLLQGRKGTTAAWHTYGRNTWSWYATHTNGAPAVVTSDFNTGSAHGGVSSDPTPAMTPSIRDVTIPPIEVYY